MSELKDNIYVIFSSGWFFLILFSSLFSFFCPDLNFSWFYLFPDFCILLDLFSWFSFSIPHVFFLVLFLLTFICPHCLPDFHFYLSIVSSWFTFFSPDLHFSWFHLLSDFHFSPGFVFLTFLFSSWFFFFLLSFVLIFFLIYIFFSWFFFFLSFFLIFIFLSWIPFFLILSSS